MSASIPEPPPRPGKTYVFPVIEQILSNLDIEGSEDFLRLIRQRRQYGLNKYGTELMTHNGRNSFEDAFQEIGDCMAYVVQAKLEGYTKDKFIKLRRVVNILLIVLDTEFE